MRLLLALALLAACERADSPDPGGGSGSGLPSICRQYLRTLDSYVACPKLDADARRSIADVITKMRATWATIPANAPMPKQVADACRQGDASIKQAMASFGCP